LTEDVDVAGRPHVGDAVLQGVQLHHQSADEHPLWRQSIHEITHRHPKPQGVLVM
jgi:hypothetical protein